MSATASPPASVRTVTVAAGTTAAAALQQAGIELNGPSGAVVVREVDGGIALTVESHGAIKWQAQVLDSGKPRALISGF